MHRAILGIVGVVMMIDIIFLPVVIHYKYLLVSSLLYLNNSLSAHTVSIKREISEHITPLFWSCFTRSLLDSFILCCSFFLSVNLELYKVWSYREGHGCRFLISFAGKYLPYYCCVASSHGQSEGNPLAFDHQLYKIYVPHTEPDCFGPAFIEVCIVKIPTTLTIQKNN